MEIVKYKDKGYEDRNYFNAACKSIKQLKLSGRELEEIDLTNIIRMLK